MNLVEQKEHLTEIIKSENVKKTSGASDGRREGFTESLDCDRRTS